MKITRVVGVTLLSLLLSHATHGAEQAPEKTVQGLTLNDAIAAIKRKPGACNERTFGCPFSNCTRWATDRHAMRLHLYSQKHFNLQMGCVHCGEGSIPYIRWYNNHKNKKCVSADS